MKHLQIVLATVIAKLELSRESEKEEINLDKFIERHEPDVDDLHNAFFAKENAALTSNDVITPLQFN